MTLSLEATAEAGTTGGFERLVVPRMGDLHRHAMRMTRHHADAEDLVQDTLAKAFAEFHSFRRDSDIHAWLYRILINTHISSCRKTQRRPVYHLTGEITDQQLVIGAAHSATGMPSAEDQALNSFGDQELIAAMRALPEQFRTAVYYADIHGLQCKEIAALMETPIGTVVSRLHRGRRRLRQLLKASRSEGYDTSENSETSENLARTA
jgi:RNA polymerase sigma-70 factor (ECF subfamily)